MLTHHYCNPKQNGRLQKLGTSQQFDLPTRSLHTKPLGKGGDLDTQVRTNSDFVLTWVGVQVTIFPL